MQCMKFRWTDGVGGRPHWHGAVEFFSLFISLALTESDVAAIYTMMMAMVVMVMVMMIYFHSFIILFEEKLL